MSISHQRRQGEGTVDGQTLDWEKKSDLYKTAKEFTFGAVLQQVTRSWEIGINENSTNDLSLDGLYFGKWILNHNSQDRADNDNGRKRSQAFLKHGSSVVSRTMIIVSGDDILAWDTATTSHFGFATSLHVHKLEEDQQPQHGVQVSFIGYKVSNNPDFVISPPLVNNNGGNGNVYLTADDLTSIGYTYQWNVVTGTGAFVNPNVPNAVYVPNGSGAYQLQLIVTDGKGNVSQPVIVDGNVVNSYHQTVKNTGSAAVWINNRTLLLQPNEETTKSTNNPLDVIDVASTDFLFALGFDEYTVKGGERQGGGYYQSYPPRVSPWFRQYVEVQTIPIGAYGRVLNNLTSHDIIATLRGGWVIPILAGQSFDQHQEADGTITSSFPFSVNGVASPLIGELYTYSGLVDNPVLADI